MRGQQVLAAVASTIMAFGVQASAQTSSSGSASTQQNTTGQITTVTGCLQRADVKAGDRTVGTSGSTTGSDEQFVLLRAHIGKGPGGATAHPTPSRHLRTAGQ